MKDIVRVGYTLSSENANNIEEQKLINAISSQNYLETSNLSTQMRRFFSGADNDFKAFENYHELSVAEKWTNDSRADESRGQSKESKVINTRSKSYLLSLGEEQKKYEKARTTYKTNVDKEFSQLFSQSLNGARYQNSLFLESSVFDYKDLTDAEFKLFTDSFLDNHKPVAVAEFIKIDDTNKQIEVINSTKVYFQENQDDVVHFAYERDRKNYALPSKLPNKNYNKANINLTVVAKELFDTFEKVFEDKIMVLDKGSNVIDTHSVLQGKEQTKEELQAIEACRDSKALEKENSNSNRSSMSPSSSQAYIESKEISSLVVEEDIEASEDNNKATDKKDAKLDIPETVISDEQSKPTIKLNKITEVKPVDIESLFSDEQSQETNKNLTSIKMLQQKQINEAEDLVKKEIVQFKKDLANGGSVSSNIEKSVQRALKNNPFAKQVFETLLKDEFLTMSNKDKVINEYKNALNKALSNIELLKDNIESIEKINGENTEKILQDNRNLHSDNQKLYEINALQTEELEATTELLENANKALEDGKQNEELLIRLESQNVELLNESKLQDEKNKKMLVVYKNAFENEKEELELKHKEYIDVVEVELKAEMNELKTEFKAEKNELKTEFKAEKEELKSEIKELKTEKNELQKLWNDSLGKINFKDTSIAELELINQRLMLELKEAKKELVIAQEKANLMSTTRDLKNKIDETVVSTKTINEENSSIDVVEKVDDAKIADIQTSQNDEDDMFSDLVEDEREVNEDYEEDVASFEQMKDLDTTELAQDIQDTQDIQGRKSEKVADGRIQEDLKTEYDRTDKSKEARAWRKQQKRGNQ